MYYDMALCHVVMEAYMQPSISQLFVYPIKSCAGISVSSFSFDQKGPLFDRRWMLVDKHSGTFLSQREFPVMALISTRIEEGRVWASQVINPQIESTLCLPNEGSLLDVNIWSDNVQGFDCGDEAALWFSAIVDLECRLVYQGGCERAADIEYAESGTEVGYADGFPMLVVAASSIGKLNDACGDADIGALNFRPNIVVENTDSFSEVYWQNLATDTVSMQVVKPCQRCVIPALNPKTGQREGGILSVLLRYCRRDKKIYFGQNLTFGYTSNMLISVGDNLNINSSCDKALK